VALQSTVSWTVTPTEDNPEGVVIIENGYLRLTEVIWRDGLTIYFRLSLWASAEESGGQAIRNFAYEMDMPIIGDDPTDAMVILFQGTGLRLFYDFIKAFHLPGAIDV
jgi:hypothetical protein